MRALDRATRRQWISYRMRLGNGVGWFGMLAAKEPSMFPKRKEPKRKSIAAIFMRDIQGSASDKLAMLRKLRAAGRFVSEDPGEVKAAEDQLSTLAAMEKGRR